MQPFCTRFPHQSPACAKGHSHRLLSSTFPGLIYSLIWQRQRRLPSRFTFCPCHPIKINSLSHIISLSPAPLSHSHPHTHHTTTSITTFHPPLFPTTTSFVNQSHQQWRVPSRLHVSSNHSSIVAIYCNFVIDRRVFTGASYLAIFLTTSSNFNN